MFNTKMASIVLATAMSLGTVSVATAAPTTGVSGGISTVLSTLVSKGTITQAQADAIIAAIKATPKAIAPAKPSVGTRPSIGGMTGGKEMGEGHEGMGGFGAHDAARQAVITSTLGITAADLQAARVAGKSLATLAGTKLDALITALINYDSMQVDASVTAGHLDSTKATALKANLRTRITAEVNHVGGPEGFNKRGMAPVVPAKPSN
jgi:hypothetical protein